MLFLFDFDVRVKAVTSGYLAVFSCVRNAGFTGLLPCGA